MFTQLSQPPVGTHHKVKPLKKSLSVKLAALEKELENLPDLIEQKFKKWTNGARDFQLACMRAQILKKDVLLQAATGLGKTGIAAGPHLLPSSQGKVTFVVSPLLALEDEQVATFRDEFGLKAIAINSTNGGCSHSVMAQIIAGAWQIVLLSPEMLVGARFVDGVLRKIGSRCLAVFIDEAHCVSHWGASFRKAYSRIGLIRAFLPRDTPIVAVTATLTPLVQQDLVSKLQFNRNEYLFINLGNDRQNVSQVVRAMEHPANTFRDLDFLVPIDMSSPNNIRKGFLYCDDIKAGSLITDYLNKRVTPVYRHYGLIRPYNASMSKKYRKRVMRLFCQGKIRILVCTDAAGMGCDIPDVDIVVQWKVAETLSSWVQRAGRAARGHGRQGLSVMIVEKAAFEIIAFPSLSIDPSLSSTTQDTAESRGIGRGRVRALHRRVQGRVAATKQGAEYAVAHGQKRGTYGAEHDEIVRIDETNVTSEMLRDAKGEGIYFYVQTTNCRRSVLLVEPAMCCDLCNSTLFDQVRPSMPQQATRQRMPKRVAPVDSVRTALYQWRRAMKAKYWAHGLWGPQAILNDDTCEALASIGPIESMELLSSILKPGWEWWDKLGMELFIFLQSLDIPPLPKRGVKRRPGKESAENLAPGPSTSAHSSPSKRARAGATVPPMPQLPSPPSTSSNSTQTAPRR
ncbi:hypothetical protein CVT25_004322 [Psilocybe cyanescens]|uniref:DNA 3'-5' helicase n=1 Tax=Psilocybe cyanescens TaxID=93625 RepID=A0A409XQ40_PSICY|nr:hypothetical protein CVT25_004322 [Psilocybe cyanescens]